MRAYASTLAIRATRRVFRGPADRQAPIFRQESDSGIRRRIRKRIRRRRAATADGTDDWVWNCGLEQLTRPERDCVAHATALGTADAAKWVNRHEYCSKQAHKRVSRDLPARSRWRPTLESSRMRRSTGGRTISNSNAAPDQHSVSKRRPPRALKPRALSSRLLRTHAPPGARAAQQVRVRVSLSVPC